MSRVLLVLFVFGAALVHAQAPAVSAPGLGLVVGAGNFFSPIVSNLEKGIGFYRDGLGLEVTGEPSNADDNAPLRDMFGLPNGKLRWTIALMLATAPVVFAGCGQKEEPANPVSSDDAKYASPAVGTAAGPGGASAPGPSKPAAPTTQ